MKKLTNTIATALAALLLASGAWAGESEVEGFTENVDWEEALEWAELVDWHYEQGETWLTYYDDLQGVMWSQPANTSNEALLAYLEGDRETAKQMGLDCVVHWPTPFYLRITSESEGNIYFYSDDFGLKQSGPYMKIWRTYSWVEYDDVEAVLGYVQNDWNYCSAYMGYYYDQDETPHVWTEDDNATCGKVGSTYYYGAAGWADDYWEYPLLTTTPVTGHSVYACGNRRNVFLHLTVMEPEK